MPEPLFRVEGEQSAWLVDRLPGVEPAPADWLEKALLDVSKDRVKSVSLTGENGETIEITREIPGDNFKLVGLAETEELTYETVLDASMAAISSLTIEEVRSAEGLEKSQETATYQTYDGLTLRIGMVKDGEDDWMTIGVGYDASARDSENAPEIMP